MKRCADIPGVLPILNSYKKPGEKPWFVMGRAVPVASQLGPNPSMRASVEAIRDIANTLALMHARGISHRDVKPDNLFRFNGRWAVGDFGLAHFEGKVYVTQTHERIGPVHYIAPETLNDAVHSDGRAADVFSLSKTLWVLATGQRYPLPGEYTETVPAFLISSYVTGDRTAALDALIRACTQFNPNVRPSMDQIAAELTAWLTPTGSSQAPIRLDVGQFAAELERQQVLLETSQKRSAQITASRERHGSRIREVLRPLANDVAQTLRVTKFRSVSLSIDNFYYGFELSAYSSDREQSFHAMVNGAWIEQLESQFLRQVFTIRQV
jgi:serine/threonine protein kinase